VRATWGGRGHQRGVRAVNCREGCGHRRSAWAFGFNRQFGSVCSVAAKFGFQISGTDRCSAKPRTDEFGFGFLGSVFRFNRIIRSFAQRRKKSKRNTRLGKNGEERGCGLAQSLCQQLLVAPAPPRAGGLRAWLAARPRLCRPPFVAPVAEAASPPCGRGHAAATPPPPHARDPASYPLRRNPWPPLAPPRAHDRIRFWGHWLTGCRVSSVSEWGWGADRLR